MKKLVLTIATFFALNFTISAQNYGANPQVRYQSGYIKSNGTYVQPHFKTQINSTNLDNFSTQGNINPYTNSLGTVPKDYSIESLNYGGGQTITVGPRGGQSYINSNGKRTYVPRRSW
jgi:hypothetical protein